MIRVSAMVLAAGKGSRFKGSIPKPIAKLAGKPVIYYSLSSLAKNHYVREIILVVSRDNQNRIIKQVKKYHIPKLKKIVLGGKERRDSVGRALRHLDTQNNLVLIHDGVRPFISQEVVSRLIKTAAKSGAAILGVPVKDTIKEASGYLVKHTPDRKNLWAIQTPQVFKKNIVLRAYAKFGKSPVTDDSALAEKLGVKVKIIKGSYFNIKITTPEDLIIASAIRKYAI